MLLVYKMSEKVMRAKRFFVFKQQQNLWQRSSTSKIHYTPPHPCVRLLSVLRRWFCCCGLIVLCSSNCLLCVWSLVYYTLVCVHSSFAIILTREKRRGADCFARVVFLMYGDCECSVALLHGAEAWSSICDCRISCSYSLFSVLKGNCG